MRSMDQSGIPVSSTPERSKQQRLEALARANEIRIMRSELKRGLRAGEERLEDIITNPPGYLHSAKVAELLMSVPKVGPVRAARILEQCRVSPSKTVIGLTPRQRRELLDVLRA